MTPIQPIHPRLARDWEMLRNNWVWFIVLGAVILLAGIAGLILTELFTVAVVALVGWLFAFTGVFEVIHAFARRGWSGFWLDLLSGVLSIVVGAMILFRPVAAAAVLTMLLGVMFLVGGIFRIAVGVSAYNPYGPWVFIHGAVSILLGLLILLQWPFSTEWVIGTLVSIDMIFNGSRLISLGAVARNLTRPEPPATGSATPGATPA